MRLGVHERTVRNYLRSGALQGTRIGKQYRISGDALAVFAGGPVMAPDPTAGVRAEASAALLRAFFRDRRGL